MVSCFDVRSGERHFLERLRDGRSGFGSTASPVSDGKKLFYPTEDGHVFIIKADREFHRISKQSLGGEICMATPALVEGNLYFRTRRHLLAVGQGAE